MSSIAKFVFNMFQENTYIIYDETLECLIIDPGCFDESERKELLGFITEKKLKPVKLINTHCHVDHMLGNYFIREKFQLNPYIHHLEEQVLTAAPSYAQIFGVKIIPSPPPAGYLSERDIVEFGNTKLHVLFTPGHSPGEICLFCKEDNYVIAGDVLFQQSIGRTDLPGGDYNTLIKSIKEKLLPLGDAVKVYCGHGPETTVGDERKTNPFLN